MTETTQNKADIRIDFPEAANPRLQLAVGPAKVRLAAGESQPWVRGTYRDNQGNLPHHIEIKGATARITHDRHVNVLWKGQPEFNLQLGTDKPFGLAIDSGASELSPCDLGGVPLTDLGIKLGAGTCKLDFSKPNPTEMTRLSVTAGAAEVSAVNLANANAAEITLDGGAADLTVNFSGELKRETRARLKAGVAVMTISVPATTAAKISIQTVLGNQKIGDGFTTKEGALWTPAAISGAGPVLFVNVTGALGEVRLRLTEENTLPSGEA
jgi:hypothetical protein